MYEILNKNKIKNKSNSKVDCFFFVTKQINMHLFMKSLPLMNSEFPMGNNFKHIA